ncbi:Uncharacterized protein NF27_ES00020 [Candidatus Jidaibacter acanthamoeba]|uniref:Fido domain-containing protein n=1 Tax=Candidatus Jidaibacter acanthamoebae TaxID=86105 RepID=A0A0C1QYT4_9RICK|nr:Fic family protein [Candidatus Jidaibacter acanthamoeba]KIE05155.1 Uncharacterized protein NF27_ES00020 [Candidatus Jidaibacter acanthamoeba]
MANERITGEYKVLGSQTYFIPKALPPYNPELEFNREIINLYGRAMHALGNLDGMIARIPDKDRFLKAYVLKEAILTSDIEGIHTTLIDVLSHPYAINKYKKDTQLVINYSHALYHAMDLIKNDGLPIVSRVIREAHNKLLHGEGDRSAPGEFRKQQVKVGNLVPAPANIVPELISDLERFINANNSVPPLIKAGLAHVQFETIHPFLDGNGRIGRLLIVLMLVKDNVLKEPLLYPSYFFKKFHLEYYTKLDNVRVKGDFEGWIEFYLRAVSESAEDAARIAKEIEALESKLIDRIKSSKLFIRSFSEAKEFLGILFKSPVITINEVSERCNVNYNTAKAVVKKFEKLEILERLTEQKRNKAFQFSDYIKLLN